MIWGQGLYATENYKKDSYFCFLCGYFTRQIIKVKQGKTTDLFYIIAQWKCKQRVFIYFFFQTGQHQHFLFPISQHQRWQKPVSSATDLSSKEGSNNNRKFCNLKNRKFWAAVKKRVFPQKNERKKIWRGKMDTKRHGPLKYVN